MDDRRFDDLARTWDRLSRRGALRLTLAVGGLLGGLGGSSDAAAKAKKCPKARRCGKQCCPKGQSCQGGACACPADKPNRCGSACQAAPCGCTPDCAGKPACADDGCGGACPGCGGGRVCAGGSCACPPGKKDCGFAGCGECCIDRDCGSFNGMECAADTLTCRCWEGLHECGASGGPRMCWSCCTSDHCRAYQRDPGNGFYCNTDHACVCQQGTSECWDGTKYYCADLKNDEFNCGSCGFPCGPYVCANGFCVPPG